MNAKQLIAVIRAKIPAGANSITVPSLERLLVEMEPLADAQDTLGIEHAKLQHASDLAAYSGRLEVFKSAVEMAKVLIQSLILINGGSAVALLAFIGHLASGPQPPVAPASAFATPLALFVIGVGAAALFAGFVTLGQKFYADGWKKSGNATVPVSVICALSSIAAFAAGSFLAHSVFARL
jgi:hypothetical protein